MIQELEIENFRAIEKKVKIRFRPITVLIGQNSSGKSTILKFLKIIRQSLEIPGNNFFSHEGNFVDLGPFKDLKNSNAIEPILRFKIKIQETLPDSLMNLGLIKVSHKEKKDSAEITLKIPKKEDEQISITCTVSAKVPYTEDRENGYQNINVINDTTGKKLFERKHGLESGFLNFPPSDIESFNFDNPEEFLKLWFHAMQSEAFKHITKNFKHVSAFRQEFRRSIISGALPPNFVGFYGQFTLLHLQKIFNSDNENQKQFIEKHLKAIAHIANPKFYSAMEGYLTYCKATNNITSGESLLADFGFGVSQCLPVIVQAALMSKGECLLVEQPEAHLHPTAQLDMGQIFTDIWTQWQVPSVIETHSANILLRLRRLVAREEIEPNDVSVAYFHYKEGKVVVENLDIDQNGNLSKGLPMEFFGADILESFEIAKKK